MENARTPAERFQADACPMPLRLVLAGDAAMIRQAIAELLQQAGVEAVAQADNAPSLVRAVENNRCAAASASS